uniref:Uncharacterized protein n=1 Tax=Romanomermis culicivorax TaxID=13658 RepID=A0A915IZG7_ROMCU
MESDIIDKEEMLGESSFNVNRDNWSVKAIRRKTTGTGRMRHLKKVHRRFRCIAQISVLRSIIDPDPKGDPKSPDYFAGPGPGILEISDPEPDPILLKFGTRYSSRSDTKF